MCSEFGTPCVSGIPLHKGVLRSHFLVAKLSSLHSSLISRQTPPLLSVSACVTILSFPKVSVRMRWSCLWRMSQNFSQIGDQQVFCGQHNCHLLWGLLCLCEIHCAVGSLSAKSRPLHSPGVSLLGEMDLAEYIAFCLL